MTVALAAVESAGEVGLSETAARLAAGRLVDVAARGEARQSSISRWSRADDAMGALRPHERDYGFHTDLETDPWWLLRLDRTHVLHFVIIHNRLRRFRERAAALTVEVSPDGVDWTPVHRGLCHFGGDGDPEAGPPLVLPLAGALESRFLRLSLPGRSYLHLARVEVLAEAGPVATTAPRKVFLAARRDGFGERLRALMNAMILAERFGGDFRFAWEEAREFDRAAHAILPGEETFARDFVAAHATDPGVGPAPFRRYARIAGAESIEAGDLFRVEQRALAEVLPEVATALPASAGAAAFRRIRFSERLERGRGAAFDLDLPEGAVAIHLRAGDLLYGQHRLVGHFAGKAMAWPLAFGLAAHFRSEGRAVLVFGQDKALCRHLAVGQGGVFAGDVAADRGLDLYQSVLFEIALMSRCSEIYAGASGFALAACQIAGTAPGRAESCLGPDAIRGLFLRALEAPAEAAITDLQRAFAFWSAAFVHANLFEAVERSRFLAAASRFDPDNCLYRLAYVGASLEAGETASAAAALTALVEAEAERADGTLRFVLAKRRSSGRSTAGRIVEGFARLVRRDHVGAHLCLALGTSDLARARASAARFLKLRPAALAAYDPDVHRVLASA